MIATTQVTLSAPTPPRSRLRKLAEPETPNAGRFAEPSERTQQEGQEIQKVAATASDPFQAMQASDLPAEPCAEDPLVPAAEVELEPQAETPQADVQQAAGQEPTLAEPRDPPYGRRATPDRNGSAPRTAARDLYGEPGPNAAPSVEHTPLNARGAEPWSRPSAENGAPPQDAPYGREPQRRCAAPWEQRGAPPAATNEMDAPAAEFAPPEDDMARHHHDLGRTPTPDGTYTVAPNDSFWTISQKVYGTGSYFKAIQRHNRKPGSQADGLEIGEKIMVPPVETLQQKYPSLCPSCAACRHKAGG